MTDAQFAMFEQLVARPFLVLDTEYCRDPAGDGSRLISLAVTPVIRGRRGTGKDGELYVEMNPGVPIDAATSAVHGFTDTDVAGKRPFRHYAARVVKALQVPGAILVTHTGADIHVLRRELERLDQAAVAQGQVRAPVGLSELPDLPLLDTSTLPRMLGYPGVGNRGIVSLGTLCQLTGVTNEGAHDAKQDARATAAALLRLLGHSAREFQHASIEELLTEAGCGTARHPRVTAFPTTRGAGKRGPSLTHLGRHASPLTTQPPHPSAPHGWTWQPSVSACAARTCAPKQPWPPPPTARTCSTRCTPSCRRRPKLASPAPSSARSPPSSKAAPRTTGPPRPGRS